MTQRLTTEQLNQIIAEAQKLQARRDAEIEPEQVRQILEELGLSSDLLDEAFAQVQRERALEAQQKHHRTILIGLVAVGIIAIASTFLVTQYQNSVLARVSAPRDRITFTQDDGSDLSVISRQNSSELFYRVTLNDAPVGQKLDLSCNWIDPNGQVVKQNRYQTRKIDKPIWDTYCRYTIGSASPVGQWKVQMFLQNRQLSEAEFQVK